MLVKEMLSSNGKTRSQAGRRTYRGHPPAVCTEYRRQHVEIFASSQQYAREAGRRRTCRLRSCSLATATMSCHCACTLTSICSERVAGKR